MKQRYEFHISPGNIVKIVRSSPDKKWQSEVLATMGCTPEQIRDLLNFDGEKAMPEVK